MSAENIPHPTDASIILTYRCPMKCKMCNIWFNPTNKSEEIKASDLRTLPKLKFINLTGGEPFVREDLAEIVEECYRHTDRIVISTSGWFEDRVVALAKKFPNIGIRISIEGLSCKNDELRGHAGGFDKGLRTLLTLKEMGLKDIGFGCTVPAVMAARTLPSERDRTMTILLTPFMSCSAKIPIYAFFSAAFFPKYAALVMIGLYVLGILFGILSALVLKSAFRGRPVPFVMELPNYRLPSVKSVALLLWDKAKDFIERAFTVIFLATIVIWFLQSFDTRLDVVTSSEQSLLAMVGRWLAPIFAPLGFADWRCATALITGFIAKESVVSTLQILLGTAAVSTLFTAKAALSFLVFTLLYTPCVAAIAAIRRETGSALRAALIALSQCCIAWLAAFAVYHLTLLL